jgi:predicted lipoprotein with Yx(FWY)xxD motif
VPAARMVAKSPPRERGARIGLNIPGTSCVGRGMDIRDITPTRWVVGALALVAATCLAACGSASSSPTTTAPAKAPSTTVAPTSTSTTVSASSRIAALSEVGPATATGLTVSLAKGPKGIFLIGPNGRSLYIFMQDKGSDSACVSAACAKLWPALTVKGTPTSGPGINSASVATAHGQLADQVTYYGHLLYYFDGDSAAGQTNGTSIPDWDLLGPFGNVMLPQG